MLLKYFFCFLLYFGCLRRLEVMRERNSNYRPFLMNYYLIEWYDLLEMIQ